MKRSTTETGSVLIEAVIALLIIGVAMTALAASWITAIRSSTTARTNQQATDLAAQTIERLRTLNFSDLALLSTDSTDAGDPALSTCPAPTIGACLSVGGTPEPLYATAGGLVTPRLQTVTGTSRQNVSFDVRTYVTTPTGAVDYRRAVVVVSWRLYGQNHSRTVDTLIAKNQRGLPLPSYKVVPSPTSVTVQPGGDEAFQLALTNNGAPDSYALTASQTGWTFYLAGATGYGTSLAASGSSQITGLVQPGETIALWAVRSTTSAEPLGTSSPIFTFVSRSQPSAATASVAVTTSVTVQTGVVGGGSSGGGAVGDCVYAGSAPGVTAANHYSLTAYYLANSASASSTTTNASTGALSVLNATTTPPVATNLPDFSNDVSGSLLAGRTVFAGGGLTGTDLSKYINWTIPQTTSHSYKGGVRVRVWVKNGVNSNVTVNLYAHTKHGSTFSDASVATIPITAVTGCGGFQELYGVTSSDITVGKLGTGEYLGLRLYVATGGPVAVAYDSTLYGSRIVLPEGN